MFFKKPGGVSWLIVFLGNPGPRYEMTRHNAGFMAADAMAKEKNVNINKARFKALTATCDIGGESVLLMKPQTFMNLSGDAVAQAARFYKIPPEHVIVVSDEISLRIGKLRIRTKGSAGGHNGLKDIIAKLGTDAFPRIRIGVGAPPHPDYDMADWVLSSFKNQDAEDMKAAAKKAEKMAIEDARFVLPNACATKMIVTMNARSLMNFFSHRCCNRAQWEIRELAEEMYRLVYQVAPTLFRNAGPSCTCGGCTEGKMTCGKAAEVREKYRKIREEMSK